MEGPPLLAQERVFGVVSPQSIFLQSSLCPPSSSLSLLSARSHASLLACPRPLQLKPPGPTSTAPRRTSKKVRSSLRSSAHWRRRRRSQKVAWARPGRSLPLLPRLLRRVQAPLASFRPSVLGRVERERARARLSRHGRGKEKIVPRPELEPEVSARPTGDGTSSEVQLSTSRTNSIRQRPLGPGRGDFFPRRAEATRPVCPAHFARLNWRLAWKTHHCPHLYSVNKTCYLVLFLRQGLYSRRRGRRRPGGRVALSRASFEFGALDSLEVSNFLFPATSPARAGERLFVLPGTPRGRGRGAPLSASATSRK